MADDKFSVRRSGSGVQPLGHGLASSTPLRDSHSDGSASTELGSTRKDPLKDLFERREAEKSFSRHVDKIKQAYDRHSNMDIHEMIRAKMKSEGELEEERPSSLYTDSTSDVQRMIRAKKRMEEESSEPEGGQDDSD